jgi:predicted Zn-dependent peptidase
MLTLLAALAPFAAPAHSAQPAPPSEPAEFSRDVLPGGLAVLVEERPGTGLVALEIAVLAGARYETAEMAGAAAFLEQMLQEGTPSRPTRRDVYRSITARGGDLTIASGWERVRLAAEVASEDFDIALDVLADLLLRSHFAPDRMEPVRERILAIIAEREDSPAQYLGDVTIATVLGDPELRHLPSGSRAGVRALSHEQLLRYRDTHFVAGNVIVAVAGDVRRAEVVPKIAAALAPLPPGPRRAPLALPPAPTATRIERPAGSEQANVAVAARGPGVQAADRAALVVLSGVLGGGGQRLYTEIRDRRGLAYAVGASLLQMADVSVLFASAGTEPPNAAEVSSLLLAELQKLRDAPPSEEEVARAIAYFVDGQVVDLETVSARANELTRREALYGVAPPREQFRAQLRAVRPADVQAAAQRYLAPERLLTVVLRPP